VKRWNVYLRVFAGIVWGMDPKLTMIDFTREDLSGEKIRFIAASKKSIASGVQKKPKATRRANP